MNSNEKITRHFDRTAPKREKWMRRHWYYYKLIIQQLRFIIPENSSVLEIGCGTGKVLAALKPKRGVGIDVSGECIKLAQQRFPHLKFMQADAHTYKSNEKFDYILIINTIGYFEDIQKALENVKQNCDANTRIIIMHYNFFWFPFLKIGEALSLKTREPIENWVSPTDVNNFIEICGLDLIKSGSKIAFPFWTPGFSWMANKYIANLPGMKIFNLMHYYIARLPSPLKGPEKTCSIIIPARNEQGNIEPLVQRVPELGKKTEIIFIEGHSKDETYKEIVRVAKKYKRTIRYAKQEGIGKADAVRKGFSMAKNDILFILDADMTVPPEEMPKFYELIASGKGEFINGSRLVYPLEKKAMRPINLIGNKIFSIIFTYLLGQRFKDTLCGTKVLTKNNYEKIAANRHYFGEFDPFGDFDLIFGASKQNLKIVELPIRYKKRVYGETNISRWKHGWLLLRMCFIAMKRLKFV